MQRTPAGAADHNVRAQPMIRKSPKPAPDLKAENVRLKVQVAALKTEVGKLQRENVSLKVKNQSALLRIKALEKAKIPPEEKPISEAEAASRLIFAVRKLGFHLVDSSGKKVDP